MASMPAIVVEASKPELVAPAGPTPHEFKYLSAIDSQEAVRIQFPVIQYYKNEPKMDGRDPARVVKEALAKALVFYYPFAGRIREAQGSSSSKLMVECTGEGVLFVEADANVSLEELGERLPPPLPWLDKFLIDVPESEGIIGCPLMLIQVTRLACGGFVVALRFNHTMCDAEGLVQFLNAVAELARTHRSIPTVEPVWERHLLTVPSKDDQAGFDPDACGLPNLPVAEIVRQLCYGPKFPIAQLVERSFFFGPGVVSSLKSHLSGDESTTSFEVVAATTWRCRAMALRLDPDEEALLLFMVNYRSKIRSPLPVGYYGNVMSVATAVSAAGRLCRSPLSYAIQLVKKAKSEAWRAGSVEPIDMTPVITGGVARVYVVSDNRHSGFERVDYGWGKAEYGGPADGGNRSVPGIASIYAPFKNRLGEEGVVVPLCLPEDAMKRFVAEVVRLIELPITEPHGNVGSFEPSKI